MEVLLSLGRCRKVSGSLTPFPRGTRNCSGGPKGGGDILIHTPVRGTMFVRIANGAVTPGPSCERDITFFGKGRPKFTRQSHDKTVAARGVQSVTVPSSRVSRECHSPGLRYPPPFKNQEALKGDILKGDI